jgi:hypothetical protein
LVGKQIRIVSNVGHIWTIGRRPCPKRVRPVSIGRAVIDQIFEMSGQFVVLAW